MLLTVILLIAGLAVLVFAGDYLVKGATGLAENLGIPPLVIGLTIVAFGTSAPELFISVQAALFGKPGIAIGNVLGSNISNVLLVLGVPALIAAIHVTQKGVRTSVSVMLGVTAAFMVMMADGVVSRIDGLVLLAGLAGFIGWQLVVARNGSIEMDESDSPHDAKRIALYLGAGLIGLPVGAQLTVDSASEIARMFEVSDAVIGLTIVAIGTSLPELATSVMAARRGSSDVAIGNVVGSNIFNILAIMGVTSLIIPVAVAERFVSIDMWVTAVVSLVLAVIVFGRMTIGRPLGAALTLAFLAYLISVF
jgi:cation:H+ antiporter